MFIMRVIPTDLTPPGSQPSQELVDGMVFLQHLQIAHRDPVRTRLTFAEKGIYVDVATVKRVLSKCSTCKLKLRIRAQRHPCFHRRGHRPVNPFRTRRRGTP